MLKKKSETSRGHALGGGVVAGLVGGLVLTVIHVVAAVATEKSIWPALKTAGAPFTGERAFEPGFVLGPVVVGLLSHFAVSIVWGVLFALLFYGASKAGTVFLGALWGIVVWLGMFYVVLPIAGLGEISRSAPIGMAVLQHVLFGLTVGLAFLPYQRSRLSRVGQQPVAT